MSGTATKARAFVLEEFFEIRRNTLRGFAKVAMPSGMVMSDVAIHTSNGRCWASRQ
jgi:hypothetical protein